MIELKYRPSGLHCRLELNDRRLGRNEIFLMK